ncbi:metallophosphoesterase [Parapedobacter sp. ISTM3]|uniref:metallophosphoesterase n=1 Tax=Parapedobacter sp. ISTM3 TaxID=2800130 RepID=UPI0019048EE8|nr:metallophosphoesterase [Parapedobacter sp. ISTM3]MBK1442164.1 metallophosphoesterase [Parapedobacter sp. ISTM3]
MIVFNTIVLLLLDYYIYKALRATPISWAKSRLFPRLWWGYSLFLTTAIFISIYLSIPLMVRSIILVMFFLTFMCKFIFILVLLADDIRRGGVWLKRLVIPKKKTVVPAVEPSDPLPERPVKGISRSEFLTKAGILVASVPLAPMGWGVISGAYDYKVRRQKLYLPNLPKEFHGIKIGQLSDIHSGSFYNKTAVQGGVEMLLAEKPDVIFFTGDLVNHLANEMRDYQDIFSKVQAPLGVYSTLGNHDYGDYHYGPEPSATKAKNLQDLKETHKVMGWDLLLNEHRKLRVDNEELGIIGVENWGTGRFPKHGRLGEALKGTDELPVKLLLSHDPSHWRAEVLSRPDVDVMFAGHTHGMQFGVRAGNFKWSPAQYIYKEWAGLYKQGHQQLYVNTGFGFLGYPGRVGILPEITIFELIKGEQPSRRA